MRNDKKALERLQEVKREINSKIQFGLDYMDEQKELDEIESILIKSRFAQINDEFIKTHKWHRNHISGVQKWDLVIHENTVYRIIEVLKTTYNEVSDTFNYTAKLIGLFTQEVLTVEFGYYDMIEILADK